MPTDRFTYPTCLAVVMVIGSVLQVEAQTFAWAGQLIGHGVHSLQNMFPGASRNMDMTVDDVGNIYVVGHSNDTIDFDPGPDQYILSGLHSDLYLAKYNANGQLVWADLFIGSSPQNSDMVSVDLDPQGNIVLIGHSTGALDMDPGPGVFELAPDGTPNQVFIAKYDPAGTLIWAKNMGGPYGVMPFSMDVTTGGEILMTGNFYQQMDADPSADVDLLTSTNYALFFAKYSTNGDHVWAKAITNIGIYGGPRCIKAGPDGSIHLGGHFAGVVDFDPGVGTSTMSSSSWVNDAFVAKYDAMGELIWAKDLAVLDNADGRTVELEIDVDGSVVFLGDYVGVGTDLDPGPGVVTLPGNQAQTSTYFGRFDPDGSLLWGKGIYMFSRPWELSLDVERNIFISGSLGGADFDPGPGYAFLLSPAQSASADAWAKYDRDGNYCWARVVGNNGYGGAPGPPAFAVQGDHQYLAGAFKQSADLDPGPGVASFTSSTNGSNAYLARYDGFATTVDLGDDLVICEGQVALLDPHSTTAGLVWQDGSTAPTLTATQEGLYWLASANGNCPFADSVFITIEDCSIALTMPNVFTPNGDGVNDGFVPTRMNGIVSSRLEIFDRWGLVIHTTNNLNTGWNGTANGDPVPDGVYFWTLSWSFRNDLETRNLSGDVTLLR